MCGLLGSRLFIPTYLSCRPRRWRIGSHSQQCNCGLQLAIPNHYDVFTVMIMCARCTKAWLIRGRDRSHEEDEACNSAKPVC